MSIEYVDLVDYLTIAAELTGLDATTITRVAKHDLAGSALHAPAAGFGDTEFYPDFVDKAAVFVVRLLRTTRCPTATNERHGSRYGFSWRSTAGHGTPHRAPTMPNTRSSRSLRASGIKTKWPPGCSRTSNHPHREQELSVLSDGARRSQ